MEDKKYYDANGKEIIVTKEDFELVQKNTVIYDEKFQTKATTYLKDAFKRFCKNKSSVVAAIIIGLLMLLSFSVPILSPHDLDAPKMNQDLLPGRLFNASKQGIWDGTKVYKNIIYDPSTGAPAGFKANAVIMDSVVSEDKYLDDFSEYAYGGIYIFEGDKAKIKESDYSYDYLRHRTAVTFTRDNKITYTIKFSDEFNSNKYRNAEYRIVYQNKTDGSSEYKVLADWTTELKEYSFNMSEWLESNNLTQATGYIRIDVKTVSGETKYPALYIDSIVYSSALSEGIEDLPEEEIDEDTLALIELLEDISITDANATKNMQIADRGSWATTGTTSVIKTHVSYWTFRYDEYEASLGYMDNFEIGASVMQTYIDKGWCEYDFSKGAESFVKLSEKCPIDSVKAQSSITINNEQVINLSCEIQLYKYVGYNSMPRFIFGTDAGGYDLFTRAFSSLRKSLGVSILVFIATFAFGLVWGAISGYFGGNTDLILERLRDIIGSIPNLVLITLVLIVWERNIVVFAIAICITGWVGTAGLTRTQFYRFKGREYILSSRTLGASDARLIAKHILPNSLGTIVTSSILRIPGFIFTESTFAYLGLGLTGTDSFGVILSENQKYINSLPVLILFPSALISLLMISFNLFGNGLRDALNPSLKGSE